MLMLVHFFFLRIGDVRLSKIIDFGLLSRVKIRTLVIEMRAVTNLARILAASQPLFVQLSVRILGGGRKWKPRIHSPRVEPSLPSARNIGSSAFRRGRRHLLRPSAKQKQSTRQRAGLSHILKPVHVCLSITFTTKL